MMEQKKGMGRGDEMTKGDELSRPFDGIVFAVVTSQLSLNSCPILCPHKQRRRKKETSRPAKRKKEGTEKRGVYLSVTEWASGRPCLVSPKILSIIFSSTAVIP